MAGRFRAIITLPRVIAASGGFGNQCKRWSPEQASLRTGPHAELSKQLSASQLADCRPGTPAVMAPRPSHACTAKGSMSTSVRAWPTVPPVSRGTYFPAGLL